jgi:hypothetical protein
MDLRHRALFHTMTFGQAMRNLGQAIGIILRESEESIPSNEDETDDELNDNRDDDEDDDDLEEVNGRTERSSRLYPPSWEDLHEVCTHRRIPQYFSGDLN